MQADDHHPSKKMRLTSLIFDLLLFLISQNPSLQRRWTFHKKYNFYKISRERALRKIRGLLCQARIRDIRRAFDLGLFQEQDIIDSVIRVIKRLNWQREPILQPIFNERGEYLC